MYDAKKARTTQYNSSSTDVNSTITIHALPDEMLEKIFSCLDFKEWLRLKRTCKKWKGMLSSNQLWGNPFFNWGFSNPNADIKIHPRTRKFKGTVGISAYEASLLLLPLGNSDGLAPLKSAMKEAGIQTIQNYNELAKVSFHYSSKTIRAIVDTQFAQAIKKEEKALEAKKVQKAEIQQALRKINAAFTANLNFFMLLRLARMKRNGLTNIPVEYHHNKSFILHCVSLNGQILKYTTTPFKDDPDIVRSAIKSKPNVFKHASDQIRDSKDFVLEEITERPDIFRYVSDRLKDDIEIVNAVMSKKPSVQSFSYMSKRIRSSYDDMLRILLKTRNIGGVMKYVSKALRSNKAFIMDLFQNIIKPNSVYEPDRSNNLLASLPALRTDIDVVSAAVKLNPASLNHACVDLTKYPELVASAVQCMLWTFQCVPEDLKANADFIYKVLQLTRQGNILRYVSDSIRKNERIVTYALNGDYELSLDTLRCMRSILSNPNIALAAVNNNIQALELLDKKLFADANFFMQLIKNPAVLNHPLIKKLRPHIHTPDTQQAKQQELESFVSRL